jgi:hypothetical protein
VRSSWSHRCRQQQRPAQQPPRGSSHPRPLRSRTPIRARRARARRRRRPREIARCGWSGRDARAQPTAAVDAFIPLEPRKCAFFRVAMNDYRRSGGSRARHPVTDSKRRAFEVP